MKRWRVEPQDLWLIFTRRGIDIKKYPAILEHLQPFKKRLMPGVPGGRKPGRYEWYEIQDNIAYWQEFEQPKVIVPAITDTVNYAPDDQGFYSNDKTSIFIPPSVPYALAVVNSQVSWWFSRQTFASRQGGFYEFKPMYVAKLPIAVGNRQSEQQITQLAKKVIAKKKTDPNAFVSNLEAEIDGLVAHLYGLTEDEYRLILDDLALPDPVRVGALNAYRETARGFVK